MSTLCAAGHGPFPPSHFPSERTHVGRACRGKVAANVGEMEGCRFDTGVY